MARMFNPPHPGLTLRDDVLPALGLTVTQAAAQLDVSRVALSRVLNGRALFGSLEVERLHGQGFVTRRQDQGRDDRVAALVQQSPAEFNAGLCQPDAIRKRWLARQANS